MDKEDVVHTHTHTHIYIYIYIYIYEYYSAIKKNKITSFASTWMELECVTLSEVREGEISYDTTYMWNLKINAMNEFTYKMEADP